MLRHSTRQVTDSSCVQKVKVVVRTKPTANFAHDQIQLDEDEKTVSIHLGKNDDQLRGYINNKQQCWTFHVDSVLHNTSQEAVYEICAQELVTQLMKGFNGTLLAYGETGAGKTYTMCGPTGNYQTRGVIPRAIAQVFSEVKECKDFNYCVHVSYLEVYNETIHDLLATLPVDSNDVITTTAEYSLTIAEDERRGVYVKGLTCCQVNNEEDALNMFFEGETNRTIAEHSLNKLSSRSHCIFTITVEARSHSHSSAEYTVSHLHLVDLAGSERLSKTQPNGVTEKEAMYINRSLSFLEQVIIALNDSNRDHIPFRQSKLTHILRDSLGGNSHTVLIANVWTELEQIQETMSTLRFASRVRSVHTNPVRNTLKDPQLLIKEYEKEIQTLKEELAMHNMLSNRGAVSYDVLSGPEIEEIRQQVDSFLHGTLPDIELVSVCQVKEVFAQFKALALSLAASQSPEETTESGKPSALKKHTSGTKKDSQSQMQSTPVSSVLQSSGQGLETTGPASLKHPSSPATALKKCKTATKVENKHRESKSSSRRAESPAVSIEPAEEELAASDIESQVTRPDTPPSKTDAFEEFKRQRGLELNKVFLDNKATLHHKKKDVIELSTSLNDIKKKMDQLQALLSGPGGTCVFDGDGEGEGDVVEGEQAEEVMEEWQFNTLTQLRELKSSYCQKFKSLQAVKQEILYCDKYVTQSRRKLLEEFEKWYKAAFLGDDESKFEEPPVVAVDTLQDILDEDTTMSSAFYTAQLRTEKRGYQSVPRDVRERRK